MYSDVNLITPPLSTATTTHWWLVTPIISLTGHAPPQPHAPLRILGPECSRLRVGARHSEAPFCSNLRLEVSHAEPANAKRPLSISVRSHLYRWKCERRRGPGRTRRSIVRLQRAAVGRVKQNSVLHLIQLPVVGAAIHRPWYLYYVELSASVATCATLPLGNADRSCASSADVALGSP